MIHQYIVIIPYDWDIIFKRQLQKLDLVCSVLPVAVTAPAEPHCDLWMCVCVVAVQPSRPPARPRLQQPQEKLCTPGTQFLDQVSMLQERAGQTPGGKHDVHLWCRCFSRQSVKVLCWWVTSWPAWHPLVCCWPPPGEFNPGAPALCC